MSQPKKDAPLRLDAQRNRERILRVAMAELTVRADAPLSAIAKKAGVGQGTFYRNFPHREALVLEVYRYEMQQVADAAGELLRTRPPERALREWMDRLARFALTKAGLADAIRLVTSAPGGPAKPGPTPVMEAAGALLRACEDSRRRPPRGDPGRLLPRHRRSLADRPARGLGAEGSGSWTSSWTDCASGRPAGDPTARRRVSAGRVMMPRTPLGPGEGPSTTRTTGAVS